MRGILDIKTQEREALARYIHKLYLSLPKAPFTLLKCAESRDIWEKIENAESEYVLI